MKIKLKNFFSKLGPGIITGASDDDPSGIATYSIVGAQAGYSLLWTSLLTFPLMAAIQEMCARIGLVTAKGLAGVMRAHYPKLFLFPIILLAVIASTINIGADIGGMAASAKLVVPIPTPILAIFFSFFIIFFLVNYSYKIIARIFKWLTFALFFYILSALVTNQDWLAIFYHTFIPQIKFDARFVSLIVALFGTTISPYLFFWQASEEVEEKLESGKVIESRRIQIVTKHELKGLREDVILGMLLSNVVMFFIIATTASTLFKGGFHEIATANQAAEALRPIAGNFAFLLFALGIVGTGLLAIPVLAGGAAYAISEVFGWQEGLSKKFHEARSFYLVIILSTLIGFLISISGFNPFRLLFYTAILYGVIAPILIAVILHIANRKDILGAKKNGLVSNILGFLTLIIMTSAAVLLFVTLGR
jgi:NRAMP (natural resistance-associated macrophage protein)-like metal ion transporter